MEGKAEWMGQDPKAHPESWGTRRGRPEWFPPAIAQLVRKGQGMGGKEKRDPPGRKHPRRGGSGTEEEGRGESHPSSASRAWGRGTVGVIWFHQGLEACCWTENASVI